MTITNQYQYYLVGLVLAVTAVMTLRDGSNPRRFSAGLFWALYALVFLVGDLLPPVWVGAVAVVMALIAGFGGVMGGKHQPRTDAQYLESAKRLGNKLFVPALAIPLITMIGTLSASHLVFGGTPLLDPKATTLVSLGVVALGSSRGVPPKTRCEALSVPIMVISGIARAGTNSLLPRRLALARYSASLRGAWRPLPTPPKPAISAMATAITPTTMGGSSWPTRKTAAYSAQNRPLDQRLGLLASRSVITAVTARTKPTR